jgi:hypothetical protein
VRTAKFDVRHPNPCHADEVVGSHQKASETGSERDFASCCQADGDANHVLLGDEAFNEPLRESSHELLREG